MRMILSSFSFSRWIVQVLVGINFAAFGMLASATSSMTPVPGDFKTILGAKSSELVVWRLAENSNILVFDFPTLSNQGDMFNRITQLTEQFAAPYKRVLSGEEFGKYLEAVNRTKANFAYGHDVLVSELVLFFNLADRDKVELTPGEVALREFLVQQGLIRSWRGITQALKPDLVVVTVPQTRERGDGEPRVTESARRAVLTHELSHGEYYTNSYYAKYCQKFWAETLTDNQREIFTKFLSKYNYSVNQDELLINEMQAYLMFTPDPNSFSAAKLGVDEAELSEMRNAFRRGRPPTKLPLGN
jgi:hypothetical protein